MANLEVITIQDKLVVDSRLIAQELEISHANALLRTIRKYQEEIQEFGVLVFESQKPIESNQGGRPEVFCYLNEEQATYVMTLSKNTYKVRQCKRNLVQAFSKAKQVIKTVIPAQQQEIEALKLRLEIVKLEKALLDKREYVVTALPEPVQQKILGYQVVEKTEYRDRIIHNEEIIRDGSTVNKTQLCKRYGFITRTGTPDYRKLNRCLSQINLPSGAWKLTATIRENEELNSEYLSVLDEWLLESDRQLFLGE